jgi:hypothetical protein
MGMHTGPPGLPLRVGTHGVVQAVWFPVCSLEGAKDVVCYVLARLPIWPLETTLQVVWDNHARLSIGSLEETTPTVHDACAWFPAWSVRQP